VARRELEEVGPVLRRRHDQRRVALVDGLDLEAEQAPEPGAADAVLLERARRRADVQLLDLDVARERVAVDDEVGTRVAHAVARAVGAAVLLGRAVVADRPVVIAGRDVPARAGRLVAGLALLALAIEAAAFSAAAVAAALAPFALRHAVVENARLGIAVLAGRAFAAGEAAAVVAAELAVALGQAVRHEPD